MIQTDRQTDKGKQTGDWRLRQKREAKRIHIAAEITTKISVGLRSGRGTPPAFCIQPHGITNVVKKKKRTKRVYSEGSWKKLPMGCVMRRVRNIL